MEKIIQTNHKIVCLKKESKMLNIQIDNPELEKSIQQAYGDDVHSLANAFGEFIKQQEIKQDISISIKQLDAGEGLPLNEVMKEVRRKYE